MIITWCVLFGLITVSTGESLISNEIDNSRNVKSGDDLVSAVMDECLFGELPTMTCIRIKALNYVQHLTGKEGYVEMARGTSDEALDETIAAGLEKYWKTHEFHLQLPDFIFQEAVLTFRPGRSIADFDITFPEPSSNEERSILEARGAVKKKVLLPILLLLKMKLKVIIPILLIMVGLKAFKALVISKISLLLVTIFLIVQFCKKLGMPMGSMQPVVTESPSMIYGPAPTPAPYGPPSGSPDTSYGAWEASSGGPYARWDSHSVAYNAYQPTETAKKPN